MKTRSDSLFAKLKPAQRQELLFLMVEQCISTEAALQQCEKWGVKTSLTALSRFGSSQGLVWRLERARDVAEASAKSLPVDFEEKKRRGLAQQEFELSFSNLKTKEVVALKRLELAQDRLKLDQRKVSLLEQKIKEAEKVVGDSKLSAAEKEARIKGVFGISA